MEEERQQSEGAVVPEDAPVREGERAVLEWLRQGGKLEGELPGRWIEVFMAAGRAALSRTIPKENWLYLRIEVASIEMARRVLSRKLRPVLNRLHDSGALPRFWYLVKSDTCLHIRLRLFGETDRLYEEVQPAIMAALKPPKKGGAYTVVRELVYEPETALFGGPEAMEHVHELFFHDSLLTMNWHALGDRSRKGITGLHLSMVTQQHLLKSSGLDMFERWDVWDKVLKLRPAKDDGPYEAKYLAHRDMIRLLTTLDPLDLAYSMPPTPRKLLKRYTEGLEQVGAALWESLRLGHLQRGLRHVLATTMVFHWNRMLFSAVEQRMIAYWAHKGYAPLREEAS